MRTGFITLGRTAGSNTLDTLSCMITHLMPGHQWQQINSISTTQVNSMLSGFGAEIILISVQARKREFTTAADPFGRLIPTLRCACQWTFTTKARILSRIPIPHGG